MAQPKLVRRRVAHAQVVRGRVGCRTALGLLRHLRGPLQRRMAQYKNELAQKRGNDAKEMDKQVADARRDAEAKQRAEMDKLAEATSKFESRLKEENELARVQMETAGRIRAERENRLYRLELLKEGSGKGEEAVVQPPAEGEPTEEEKFDAEFKAMELKFLEEMELMPEEEAPGPAADVS